MLLLRLSLFAQGTSTMIILPDVVFFLFCFLWTPHRFYFFKVMKAALSCRKICALYETLDIFLLRMHFDLADQQIISDKMKELVQHKSPLYIQDDRRFSPNIQMEYRIPSALLCNISHQPLCLCLTQLNYADFGQQIFMTHSVQKHDENYIFLRESWQRAPVQRPRIPTLPRIYSATYQ